MKYSEVHLASHRNLGIHRIVSQCITCFEIMVLKGEVRVKGLKLFFGCHRIHCEHKCNTHHPLIKCELHREHIDYRGYSSLSLRQFLSKVQLCRIWNKPNLL